ncbi:MAG: hypothetical protein JNJ71_07430 [Rubrivivax sp.]|nr:hypothetical protein [Rubrivivax sp.]
MELVISMALAGVIISGIWAAWASLSTRSSDPLVARQALAVAQSLLREIELQPLPGAAAAASSPGRTGFASILDYHGLVLDGIRDAEGQAIAGLEAYRAQISVTAQALAGVPQSDGWWITVSVSGPDGARTVLGGWRARR